MKHITNNDLSLISSFYSIGENNYEVIKTESVGDTIRETVDTIRNILTGEIKEVERNVLFNFTR